MSTYNILSVNFNHDGSAAIIMNGKIKGYINTERFSKKKKHPGMRKEDLDNVLAQAKLQLTDINMVILCNIHIMDSPDIPFLYGTNLKETWFNFWVNQLLDRVVIDGVEIPCLVNPDHQLLHCALAYFTSGFEQAVCFSWDPTGYAAFMGKGNKMTRIDYVLKEANCCEWYSEISTILFGTSIEGAGKVMGLAPYGEPAKKPLRDRQFTSCQTLKKFADKYPMYIGEKEKKVNAALAYHVQLVMERQLTKVLEDLYAIASGQDLSPNLCLSGGGALNSVANQVAFEKSRFEKIHIHPASGDDGTAIGAGLWYWFDFLNNERSKFSNREIMYSVLSYEDTIEDILSHPDYTDRLSVNRTPDYIEKTARLIAGNKIVGWFQDSSEIGPRSLGNRSILANPCIDSMKQFLNQKVKFRENFRPFAPSVLNEHAQKWFGLQDSPFMLRVCNVLEKGVPSVTHVDDTARIQTVNEEDNHNFYHLIKTFYDITGVPCIINTSFNIKGQPIVETPKDAIECFLNTEMDALVFKNKIVEKKYQPATAAKVAQLV